MMRTASRENVDLVGDRLAVRILRAACVGTHDFEDFCTLLGIPRHILGSRLRQLVVAGLLARRRTSHYPPRIAYRLTRKGEALRPTLGIRAHRPRIGCTDQSQQFPTKFRFQEANSA
jgi:DNA-binding HxlR family transcriptional regulator